MKILMINVVCGIRSTGRICTDLAEALEEQGHEVKIAYGRETVPYQYAKYAVKIGTSFDIKMHGLKARLFDGCGFGSKKATRHFIEWVKEYDPDVIHLHNLHGYYINIEILFNYLRHSGKKIVWTLHDSWAFTGHSAYCDTIGCEKWKSGCNNCQLLGIYPKSYTDNSYSNWKRKKKCLTGIPNMSLVTPSQWLQKLTQESFLSEYSVTVIHNGIDTSVFYPTESNIRKEYKIDDKFLLLGVASTWNDMKGYSDYHKLSDMLNEDYQIILVGLTKKQKNEMPKKILGIERTANISELAQLYSAADLFLNLSYCENYPTVNLESLACGTPVLTYNTGGSPESVQGYNGIIVERGDLDGVVKAIYQYHNSINNRKPLNHIYKEVFDNKTEINNYLSFLTSNK